MRAGLAPGVVQAVYDARARWYDYQHGLVTARSDERGRRIVVTQGVAEGDSVLDAGGGTGTTSLLAARRVGPKGKVTVFDLSEGMLDQARRKARAAGLEDRMEFRSGDILHLPFADASFDAVLSTYSICPLYDPVAGVRELYRVVRPGGRLAVAHSSEPESPVVRFLARGLEAVLWKLPWLTLGCRPVVTLPALVSDGAELLFETRLGVPLWPFQVYAVRKPEGEAR